MKVIKQENHIIPVKYISALYYEDYSGLTEDDTTALDNWLDTFESRFDLSHHYDEPFFSPKNAITNDSRMLCCEITLTWFGE